MMNEATNKLNVIESLLAEIAYNPLLLNVLQTQQEDDLVDDQCQTDINNQKNPSAQRKFAKKVRISDQKSIKSDQYDEEIARASERTMQYVRLYQQLLAQNVHKRNPPAPLSEDLRSFNLILDKSKHTPKRPFSYSPSIMKPPASASTPTTSSNQDTRSNSWRQNPLSVTIVQPVNPTITPYEKKKIQQMGQEVDKQIEKQNIDKEAARIAAQYKDSPIPDSVVNLDQDGYKLKQQQNARAQEDHKKFMASPVKRALDVLTDEQRAELEEKRIKEEEEDLRRRKRNKHNPNILAKFASNETDQEERAIDILSREPHPIQPIVYKPFFAKDTSSDPQTNSTIKSYQKEKQNKTITWNEDTSKKKKQQEINNEDKYGESQTGEFELSNDEEEDIDEQEQGNDKQQQKKKQKLKRLEILQRERALMLQQKEMAEEAKFMDNKQRFTVLVNEQHNVLQLPIEQSEVVWKVKAVQEQIQIQVGRHRK
ncbi:MAG: hypothetical protein EZS28_019685 [Streblomastix strix]|uniref:Uncharacterized protein n=1 Tax=Streblomastix strix TaxID=222440 RepID=A0A5J4VQ46_9EUKA|nr:MAG: hypothetical protein EZS28_019685 [Streblomastix strix]